MMFDTLQPSRYKISRIQVKTKNPILRNFSAFQPLSPFNLLAIILKLLLDTFDSPHIILSIVSICLPWWYQKSNRISDFYPSLLFTINIYESHLITQSVKVLMSLWFLQRFSLNKVPYL